MKLSINTNPSYDVIIDYDILESFDSQHNVFSKEQLFILCFSSSLIEQANKLYLYLKNRDYNIKLLEINDGEKFAPSIRFPLSFRFFDDKI